MQTTLDAATRDVATRTSLPLIATGRIFFALGLIGMGATHFMFGDFMTGRAPPWPEQLAGGTAWAWTSGVVFICCGVAILVGRAMRVAALITALLIICWAFARNIPVAAADSLFGGQWTRIGKAWTFAGGALAVAAVAPRIASVRGGLDSVLNATSAFTHAARVLLALFLLVTGVQHFLHTGFVASLIPSWFPGDATFWTYSAGVALIAFGTGLLVAATAPIAALLAGCMVFSWFWIVHVPLTLTSVSDGVAVFEALAVAGIGLLLAGSLQRGRWPRPAVGAGGRM